jgi:hypothetical protein
MGKGSLSTFYRRTSPEVFARLMRAFSGQIRWNVRIECMELPAQVTSWHDEACLPRTMVRIGSSRQSGACDGGCTVETRRRHTYNGILPLRMLCRVRAITRTEQWWCAVRTSLEW